MDSNTSTGGVSFDRNVFPASFAQKRLWFLQRLEPESSAYNLSFFVRMSGTLGLEELSRAFTEIVRRHEALRTRFVTNADGELMQAIEQIPECFRLSKEDLCGVAALERESQARRIMRAEANRPFNLQMGPMLRASLLRLGISEHILLVCVHHIAADGWSMEILVRELGALYEAFRSGRSSPLPELPVQYADYAVWQRDRLSDAALETEKEYWRAQLADCEAFELPTDYPRSKVARRYGDVYRFEVDEVVLKGLRNLARQTDVTVYMFLLCTFSVLLSRFSGQNEIWVGSPVAGRNYSDLEGLIGCFINTLVLHTKVTPGSSFRQLLLRFRETTLSAFAHQDMPFEKLVDALHPNRDIDREPLFQVLFTLQNAPSEKLTLAGLQINKLERIEPQEVKYDLSLSIAEQGTARLACAFEYRTDLFEASTLRRLAEMFKALLKAVIANPDRRIAQIDLLSSAEHQQILIDWNATCRQQPEAAIPELFEDQVKCRPDATAIICEEFAVTYGELNERANRLANYLIDYGVGPEMLVAVVLPRSIEMVVSLLAVLKSGGAYVPFDIDYPSMRLNQLLEETRPCCVLTRLPYAEKLPNGIAQLRLDNARLIDLIGGKVSNLVRRNPISLQHAAYVIFTSGSTGKPKGVVVTHSALRNVLLAIQESFCLDRNSRLAAVTAISFDIAALEIFGPLISGGSVMIVPSEVVKDSASVMELIKCHDINVLQATPTYWYTLLESVEGELRGLKAIVGGETLSGSLCERLCGSVGGVTNVYGPTETTIWSVMIDIRDAKGYVPIGRPIANTHVYVLDDCLQPVGTGICGELYLAGLGLARGYWNSVGMTAERFVACPHGISGGRMYRTGDWVRWRSDGVLEHLGRRDSQVKIRGFRVELNEIEGIILRNSDIKQVAVLAYKHQEKEMRLAAYFVPRLGRKVEPNDLRTYTRKWLPNYMIPSTFIRLDSLPVTPNGKLDRRALPIPDCRSDVRYISPRSAFEEILCRLFSDVLGIERIGIEDNFFDLGGHSLSAARLASRVGDSFGYEVATRTIFEAPSVLELSKRLKEDLRVDEDEIEKREGLKLVIDAMSDEEIKAKLLEIQNENS